MIDYYDGRRYLVNHNIVKNRLGPYWIVVKCGELYLENYGKWTTNKSKAIHYRNGESPSMGLQNYKGDGIYLTTSAGDLLLTKKDMRLTDYGGMILK